MAVSASSVFARTTLTRMLGTSAALLLVSASANAQMTLTAAGIARNFSLTTFATGFSTSSSIGPIDVDYQTDGTVLVSEYPTGRIYRFNNVDNQTVATTPVTNYPTSEFAHGITHFGSTVYVSRYNSQSVVELNPDGSINRTVVSGLGNARAIRANTATGRLLVSCVQGLRSVDPVTGSFTTLSTDESDGITLSADGSIVYGAVISGPRFGHLIGYDTTTGAQVFDSGPISGGLDGTALGFGIRAGYVYGNLNNGNLIEINLTTLEQITIATGGSRGDFVSADPSGSGDLLLTQTDRVLRLSGIPTPGGIAVAGMGLVMVGRRRRR